MGEQREEESNNITGNQHLENIFSWTGVVVGIIQVVFLNTFSTLNMNPPKWHTPQLYIVHVM